MIIDEYLDRLVESSHIDIYISGSAGARFYWPWRMQPVHEASPRYVEACDTYAVDSSFNDESIGNEDVLDMAHKLGADIAVLEDVYGDADKTIDRLKDGIRCAEKHDYDGKIMLPLQPPHRYCLTELPTDDIDMVAIGGYKDQPVVKRVQAAKSIRETNPDVHIHGLGWGLSETSGMSNGLVDHIHENPDIIDSIDYSTPVQETLSAEHRIDKGKEFTSIQAAKMGAILIRDLRRVSDYANVESSHRQVTLT